MVINFRTNEYHYAFLLNGVPSTTRVLVDLQNFGDPQQNYGQTFSVPEPIRAKIIVLGAPPLKGFSTLS